MAFWLCNIPIIPWQNDPPRPCYLPRFIGFTGSNAALTFDEIENRTESDAMRKSELSPTQLRDWNVFNLLLEHNGWVDTRETEKLLDAGESVNPEGLREWRQTNGMLQARFHAPVNMISLRITDNLLEEMVQFHFLYDHKPERILEWMVEVADTLSLESYPELLKQADGRCEMILLEVSDTEIYEVKPPTNA